jgi:hypothetical protein
MLRAGFTQEALPRYSSGNFEQDDIGEPILEVRFRQP